MNLVHKLFKRRKELAFMGATGAAVAGLGMGGAAAATFLQENASSIGHALVHGAQWEGVAGTINRALVGTFFTISGWHKLTNKDRHATLVSTLIDLKVPFVKWNQWFVPSVEFAGGLALAFGIFPVMAAMLLGAICLIAACTDGVRRVKSWNPIDKADTIDDVLYLPEVLYGLILLEVILTGPGKYRLDALFL